jgi:hypothetical protein
VSAHAAGPWKVVPCPIHAGKHPCHDARWIMTADANVEMSDYVPDDWALTQGSIVCQMRDGDPRDAHLIAAAPELLAALEMALGAVEYFDEHEGAPMLLDAVRAAIAQARGGGK